MRPVLKLCGLLAVFALAVLANPTNNKNFDEAKLSQDEILQSNGYMNDGPTSADENATPEELAGKSDETTTVAQSPAPTPEQTPLPTASSSTASSSTASSSTASPPTAFQTSSSTKGKDEETTPTTAVPTSEATTEPTTTPKSSSTLASPNKILSFAALIFMLIVKMFGAN